MSGRSKQNNSGNTAVVESIYGRMGGAAAVEAAVDDFCLRVLADPDPRNFFSRVNMKALKMRQRAFFARALGGTAAYRGRDMRTAHAHLKITGQPFNKVAGHWADATTTPKILADGAPLASEICQHQF